MISGRYYLLLVLSFYGCSLLKNKSKTTFKNQQRLKEKMELITQEQKNWLKDSGSFSFYKDSANRNYAVQLWPKGVFTYSPEKGFSGEADSVLIKGNSQGILSGVQSTNVHEQDIGKLEASLSRKNKLLTDQESKTTETTLSWKWLLAMVVFIILLSAAGYGTYKKSHFKLLDNG